MSNCERIGIFLVWMTWTTCACAEPFTVVMLPDTQIYSWKGPSVFRAQTQWIVGNRVKENIVFVTHVGDIVEHGNEESEWVEADAAMDILDGDLADSPDGLLPYSVAIGNHDYDKENVLSPRGTAHHYVQHFGAARYEGRSWYGGSSANQLNHYQFFEGDGQRFLHIVLEMETTDQAIEWARNILRTFPDTPTIITVHMYLGIKDGRPKRWPERLLADINPGDGYNSPEEIFQKLVFPFPNVLMVLNGHTGEQTHQTSMNAAGLPVFEMLANFQDRAGGGNMQGWLQLITFDFDKKEIRVRTFSPTLNRFETDGDSQFHFDLDFEDRFKIQVKPK